jgi:protoheme IX farnesyltransferase
MFGNSSTSKPLCRFRVTQAHRKVTVLFAILFLWQFPHFHAIAWLYREEYEKVGIKMLAVVKPTGSALNVEIMTALLLLIPATLAPTFLQMAGNVYLVAAILLNLAFLYFGVQMSRQHDRPRARKLLLASVIYVPLLFAFLVVDNPRFTSLF